VIPARPEPGANEVPTPSSIIGRVVGLPMETSSALGLQSLSVEVAAADAVALAAADDVRVVLVEPGEDPASAGSAADEPEPGPDAGTDASGQTADTGEDEP
jgi:hypothetical protein